MTREANILSYINEWHGGFWWLVTKEEEGIPERVADNVIAYHDLKDNAANQRAYTVVARKLIGSDSLKLVDNGAGWLALEVQ